MPATVEILTIPLGSQLTSTISGTDKEDKNDFPVLFLFSENVNLPESGIMVSAGAMLVSLEGANSVWMGWVRPPQTAGTVTVTVNQNSVSQGNPETSKDIRVSTGFPDADAEVPTHLFNHNLSYTFWRHGNAKVGYGITCSPSRIIISSNGDVAANSLRNYIDFFTYDGTHQSAETITIPGGSTFGLGRIDFINGDLLYEHTRFTETAWGRLDLQARTFSRFVRSTDAIVHTRLGVTRPVSPTSIITHPYDDYSQSESHTVDFAPGNLRNAAHQNDLLYLSGTTDWDLAAVTDDGFEAITRLNIALRSVDNNTWRDIAIFGDTLYLLDSAGVHTLDVRKYRPVAKNTKTTIYPVFIEAGGTLDLKQFSPDAERIVFDVGYDKPPYLSINANNELAAGSGAQTCLVKLKAINRIDATETDSFQFYLIIRRAAAPVWRDVSELTMRAGNSYNLFQLVPDAESISFRSGRTRLTGSSLSNGIFTIGTVGGVAEFTARKDGRSSHIAIHIDVVSGIAVGVGLVGTDRGVSGYRVEIADIDVTADVLEFPSVSETLDPVVINEYRVNEAAITLRNEGGKYNSDLAGNFWETNGLNAGGFQNGVKIYIEYVDGAERLLFTGVINESFEPIKDATFKLNCTDISARLRKALTQDFGTLEKWDALRKQSDEDSYEGIYVPERSLLPMQVGTGEARSDRTDLEISRLELPSEGPTPENTGYMTLNEFRTAGGFLPENPLLRFKGEHLSEDVRFLINQLAINKEVYNTEIDIPGVEVEVPFLLNRGSVAFSVEQTRTTRLPVDWVHDPTNNRILVLLSNPEGHISDLLVQYDIERDAYRVLHTFDKGISVHRIARRNGTNYYILTSKPISENRSAPQLPRPNDSAVFAYDAVAEGSEIKIYHYSTSTGTLTEHVAEDDSFPPQLGIHYHIGFENGQYVDEFEGVVPDYRGAFKWQSGNLYYRYAKDGEFGVARVNASGTTTQVIAETSDSHCGHLNFAFDINSSGTVYLASATEGSIGPYTVVATTAARGPFTIADDLSSYETPFQLKVDLMDIRGNNPRILVQGVDPDGNTIFSDNVLRNFSGDRVLTLSHDFARVTGFSTSRVTAGTVSVTTVPIPICALQVKRRVSGGTPTTLIDDAKLFTELTDLDANGGVHLGCYGCVFHNNYLYILVQIGRVDVEDSDASLSRTKAAGMVLYRVATNTGTPTLTVLEKWDFVHQAGCNLVVHDGAVHYVEQPSAATAFKPINPDLDGYWTDDERTETLGYNVVEESLGALKKINSRGEVEHLGNVWHTDRPYNVFPTRMLSIDNALHLCAGYGNLDELLRYNSPASGADNFQHIVYGRTLHYVLPRFSPSGSIYAALASLAKSVNATLSFEKNVIMISDRRPYRALTDSATGTGTGNLSFSDANKPFPSSGYLLIGKEILSYTGITGGAFTGVQRGVLGSPIENHANASKVLYLDNLIRSESLGSPYKAITLQSDTNRIFNIIRDSGGIAEVRDEDSIARYGERPYTLDLGLTRHEKAWIEEIFKSYLAELKDLQSIVNIQVIPDDSLRLGQIVAFFYKGLVRGMRIVSIRYERRATHLKGRTL